MVRTADKLAKLNSYLCFAVISMLLSVSLKDLDAATELKRFFGASVVAAAESSSALTPSYHGRQANRRVKPTKGVLVQPQSGWPRGARAGIACDISQTDNEEIRNEDVRVLSRNEGIKLTLRRSFGGHTTHAV